MNDLPQAARAALAAKVLGDELTLAAKPARADAQALMVAQGAERVRVLADDGVDLGTASLAGNGPRAKVVDERAFAEWVALRYPTFARTVVDTGWQRALLTRLTRNGDTADPHTGEVIPGLAITSGHPYLSIRPTEDARERMRDVLRGAGLLALPAGEET